MKFLKEMLNIFLVPATVLALTFPVTAAAVVKKGDPAPPINVTSTSGQGITLANYKGRVLIVDFFASWCPPCRESIPHLIELNRRYNKQGLQILGLSADEDGEKVVKTFIVDKKISYPVAMAGEQLLTAYGLRSIPTLFVIDKKGMIAEKYMGFNDGIAKSMDILIQKLLAQ